MRPLSFFVAILWAFSCGSCPAPAGVDGGADAGVAARRRPAPTPARSCASFAACSEACADAGDARPCYDASLFAFEGAPDAGRDLPGVARLADLACARGDGRGCVRANRVAEAGRLLPAQCTAGDVEACELLSGWYLAADAGPELTGPAVERTRRLLAQACEQPEPYACARLGSSLLRGRLGPAEPQEGVKLLERACHAGVPGACIELVMVFQRGVPGLEADPARAAQFGRSARELSQP